MSDAGYIRGTELPRNRVEAKATDLDKSPLDSAMDDLTTEIDYLENLVSSLLDRLHPVQTPMADVNRLLGPSSPDAPADTAEKSRSSSPIVARVSQLHDQVGLIGREVARHIDRLEI